MIRLTRVLGAAVVALSLLAAPGVGQQADGATITQAVIAKPLPGRAADFEEGAREHFEWLGEQGLDWTWQTWQIAAGPRTGSYLFATGGHNWADFDDPPVDPQAAAESIAERVAPHVEEAQVSFFRTLEGLSRSPAPGAQYPLGQIVTFWVNPGQEQRFELALQLFADALEQSPVPLAYTVFQLALGGEGGTQYVIGIPYASYAAMDGTGATGAFDTLLEAAYGEAGSAEIQAIVTQAVARSRGELLILRPDLSYTPGM